MDARALARAKVCAIGPRTAQAVRNWGIRPDLVPKIYQAEGIVDEMQRRGVRGLKVLLARALHAREVLPEALRAMGAQVRVAAAYQSVKPVDQAERIRSLLKEKRISVVTFTSSSTVTNFVSIFRREELADLMSGVVIASIGPITAETVRQSGLKNDIVPREYTVRELARAIARYFMERRSRGHET